jgi:hypothetical protein
MRAMACFHQYLRFTFLCVEGAISGTLRRLVMSKLSGERDTIANAHTSPNSLARMASR